MAHAWGFVVGTGMAVVELAFVVTAALGYAGAAVVGALHRDARATDRRRRAAAGWADRRARSLAGIELDRLGRRADAALLPASTRRLVRSLAARAQVGLLGGAVLGLTASGTGAVIVMIAAWLTGSTHTTTSDVVILVPLAGVLGYLAVRGLSGVAETERGLARRLLEPAVHEALNRRIDELAASRAGIVAAVHEERRRIERDLHDGVQQQMVALGMLLGRARRSEDPQRVHELMRQAHEQAQQALVDLREVAWRIHPTGLDDGGLRTVLDTVTERAPLPVRFDYDVDPEPAPIAATAAYFVVAEALTNAVKHGRADSVTVTVSRGPGPGGRLFVRVGDDGVGGADPSGSGLSGLARRVGALDGTFQVSSPIGGPTTIVAELPCA